MYHGKIDKITAQGLKELRKRIKSADIPPSQLDKSINLAAWNIREFGKKRRQKRSIHYIAEILGQFDLIAVTEVRENLEDLADAQKILGPYWRAVYSDFIQDAGGNRERVAYLYDNRAVAFTGMAAEADAPRTKNKETGEYLPAFSWWRSPYIASFKAGNFDFILITAHIRWGSGEEARIKPLQLLAEWIEDRRKNKYGEDKDIILMGDFNIPALDNPLFQAITSKGLRIPKALVGTTHGSNLEKNKRYDQILHYPVHTKCFTNRGGVLDFYGGGIKKLYPDKGMDKRAFTFQMSDHLPLWIALDVDLADERLDQIINR